MDNKLKTASGPRSYIGVALVAFLAAAGAAVGFGMADKGLETQAAAQKDELAKVEAEIAKLKEDKTVALSDVIRAAQAGMTRTVNASRAQDYVEALALLEAKYGVAFEGFSFQDGRVSTSVAAQGDGKVAAIRKLQALIKDARDNGGLAVTLANSSVVTMDLGRVTMVSGDDARRVASVTFDPK